jgi:hypothetical protein
MENNPQPEKFNPYSAFPAYERVKLEIFDRYLKAIDSWSNAAEDSSNQEKLKRATLKLVEWYVTVHGYTEKKEAPGLTGLRGIMQKWHELSAGMHPGGITALTNHRQLTEYVLAASLYMNELGITSILQRHREDKYYLAEGAAER